MDGTILIADDDRSIRTVLTQALSRAGCRVHATGSLQQLLKWVEEGRGDLVVTDVMMPDGNGIDTIPAIRRARPDLPVIVISAQNTIVTAIRATEAEAFDYLPKPFDLPDLLSRSRDALARRPRKSDLAPQFRPVQTIPHAEAAEVADRELLLIGHASSMQALFRLVAKVLNADLPVMVTGQAGVGKSTIARALHEFSDRTGGPLVVLTPADGASDTLARAVQEARGGTLLIENPAGFDPAAQTRLLALLEQTDSSGDAPRLVSTAGPDPQQEMDEGRLRADLFYRLAGATIAVPPLSARRDDIPPLARHLMARAAAQGLAERPLSEEVLAELRGQDYPGNVRQLENLLRRLALTGSGPVTLDELREMPGQQAAPAGQGAAAPRAVSRPSGGGAGQLSASVADHLQRYFDLHGDALPPSGLYDRILREIEVPLLEIALDATGGNQLRCAELLGINRNTLRKKLSDLNIQVTRRRRVM
ncbi:sigma-54-dependent Fis family transcriptional regulator [Paracoccus aurantiacus]|uniref:DNA-binding transcriptional regulator NtrC n=1 Tax=Paracoccus aurantiacus TaxID=2599412 RepID=A0A5C6S205_9RHOB|nr:sigma-54 dependent transcriptional regulator [Paracoccus aurantiacus]TXB68502.1 sigma-54-dependent Fis family transcriptional regulator [Paracoccus aurantiacus]